MTPISYRGVGGRKASVIIFSIMSHSLPVNSLAFSKTGPEN